MAKPESYFAREEIQRRAQEAEISRQSELRLAAARLQAGEVLHDWERRLVVGEWLKIARVGKGLSQAAVARSVGINHTAVSAIELGRNSLREERYAAYADCLGVDRDTFRGNMEAPTAAILVF